MVARGRPGRLAGASACGLGTVGDRHFSHFAHSRAERVPFGKSPGWAPAAAQTVRMRAPRIPVGPVETPPNVHRPFWLAHIGHLLSDTLSGVTTPWWRTRARCSPNPSAARGQSGRLGHFRGPTHCAEASKRGLPLLTKRTHQEPYCAILYFRVPIVYRLGRHPFKVQRRVRLPLGAPLQMSFPQRGAFLLG